MAGILGVGVIFAWLIANPVTGLFIYILPAIIAMLARKKSVIPIILIDLFLGWTFFGWWFALFWSIFGENNKKDAKVAFGVKREKGDSDIAWCQHCGTPIEGSECAKCGKKRVDANYDM
ncbi:MAG: superinfection immunity protein [Anaerorhabdus sp.]|uniref:superinfection immunity protein n=1 Tax=Anaerorhabdus sp. TaxID=1872524 RepID=UPI003A88BF60